MKHYEYTIKDGKLQSVEARFEAEYQATFEPPPEPVRIDLSRVIEQAIRTAAIKYRAYNADQIVRLLKPAVHSPDDADDAVRRMAKDLKCASLFQAETL